MAIYSRAKRVLRKSAVKVAEPIYRVEKQLYANNVLSVSETLLPDFLCIGAMKAGTTWLYENLRCHPAIYLPDRKESYFFSYQYYTRSLRQYSQRFAEGAAKIKGEITPGYCTLPVERIRFIRSILPNAKLIFLLRDPVHRAWSEANMNLAAKKGRRREDVTKQEFMKYFASDRCRQRSDYLTILDNWLSVFPRERLFLGVYEDIESSPRALFNAILTHLGVSADVDMSTFPLTNFIVPIYERDGGVHRGRPSEAHIPTNTFLPDEFRDFLTQMYADQIRALQSRYGVPVDRWSQAAT
jgi:hypothetical protein